MNGQMIEPTATFEALSSDMSQGKKPLKAGAVLKIMTIGVVGMLLAIQAGYFLRPGPAVEVIASAVGRLLGPGIVTLIVFGLFQIFRKFRTQRARWLIVLWVNLLLLMGTINLIVQNVLALWNNSFVF